MIFYIFLLFFLKCPTTDTAVITVSPVSVTVPPFTKTTFTCEVTGDILNWLVESGVLTDFIKQQRQITVTTTNTSNTNFSSVLTVNAIPINDGLGIGCEVITISPFNRVISGSKLTIRGVSPVEDIQYSYLPSNKLLITWSPPVYYSNDVPHGSPLSYQVLITDKKDGDIILDRNIPHTNIEVANITQCDTFNISVTALVYQYISMENTDERNIGSYSVNVIEDSMYSVFIEVGSMPSPHCEKKLFVKDESDGSVLVDDEILSGNYKDITLKPYRKYQLLTEVKNLRGKVEDTEYTHISTYNVQDLLVSTEGNGSVSVQCVFVSGSTADGCHVIFTDTSNGRNEYFNITGSTEHIMVTLPAGNYTASVYEIANGSLYGPAFELIHVSIIKEIPSISASSIIMSESIAPTQFINVSPTSFNTPGTETTSSTSENDNNYILPVVSGTVSVIVLVIFILLTICVVIIVTKRKMMKGLNRRSEIATCQQSQAETNQYQEVHLIINEVPIIPSSVQLTNNRSIHHENPYHVTRDEFLPDYHAIRSHNIEGSIIQWEQRPSLTSTATQKTILEDSISSAISVNIRDNEYTTNPAVTVNVNSDDTATATPTYAVIGKKTDGTAIPTVDQRVTYDKVTGDINKKAGGVTVYPSNDISAIPPPPSYADTVAQEHSAAVSSSQFVVPVQVTDAAVVHGQFEKHQPTNTGAIQSILSSASLATSDAKFANGHTGGHFDELPMNGGKILPIQFQETRENIPFQKSSLVYSSFEEAEIVYDHIYDHISDEMVGLSLVALNSTRKPGTLVTGSTSKIEVIMTSHEVQASKDEYQTQKVFEDNSDH